MEQLVIDRTKWYNGKGGVYSALLVDKTGKSETPTPTEDVGKMCCLGFYMLQCGVANEEMLGIGMPDSMRVDMPDAAEWLNGYFDTGSPAARVLLDMTIAPHYARNTWSGLKIVTVLASANDDTVSGESSLFQSTEKKEQFIAAVFKDYGNIEVIFTN